MYATNTGKTRSGLDRADFRKEVNGKQTDLFVLTNKNGVEACFTNYGANWVSMMVPDKEGKLVDVVLGHDNIDAYLSCSYQFLGAVCGRYANRIPDGKFTIDDVEYTLPVNNVVNTIHGGAGGFNGVVWDAEMIDPQTLALTYVSPDGDQGFPGTLTTTILYTLTEENEIEINYTAQTDMPTIINLTSHVSFNLSGEDAPSCEDHLMKVNGWLYTPADKYMIPSGELRPVFNTPLDFTIEKPIGRDINQDFDSLHVGMGYDCTFIVDKKVFGEMAFAAKVRHPSNGRTLEVYTTEPCAHFYTGNSINDIKGKFGKIYPKRSAFCLEMQHATNSCNIGHFPTTILREDDVYSQTTIFKFGVE